MEAAPTRPVLVIDFGAQYAQLIARRVREARVFSEVIPHTTTVEEIKARDPQAIVLSGGPASVYADGAPRLDPALLGKARVFVDDFEQACHSGEVNVPLGTGAYTEKQIAGTLGAVLALLAPA